VTPENTTQTEEFSIRIDSPGIHQPLRPFMTVFRQQNPSVAFLQYIDCRRFSFVIRPDRMNGVACVAVCRLIWMRVLHRDDKLWRYRIVIAVQQSYVSFGL
jgi:hypothetical protein